MSVRVSVLDGDAAVEVPEGAQRLPEGLDVGRGKGFGAADEEPDSVGLCGLLRLGKRGREKEEGDCRDAEPELHPHLSWTSSPGATLDPASHSLASPVPARPCAADDSAPGDRVIPQPALGDATR